MQQSGFRSDIQALRALAVSGVVIYHLAPGGLPGGFAGVDVFFVISGFLITSHLAARPPVRPADLAHFWARRIRRLLPAATLVLLSTLVLAQTIGPSTERAETARAAIAASTYWINFLLARQSVDYLHADASPTPVQHYWSLSVEEQFYALWPVVLLMLFWVSRRWKLDRMIVVGGGLALLTGVSFLTSVHLTRTDAPQAYFVTQTRIWELGIGALLGLTVAWGRRPLRTPGPALAWAGVALIAVTGIAYGATTPFPGYEALLPVMGATLVIAGAPKADATLGRILAARPLQWLGKISYSLYLWHWPLIVLGPSLLGVTGSLRLRDKFLIAIASLALAGVTEMFVERPFQRPWPVSSRTTVALGAMAMLGVVGMGSGQLLHEHRMIVVATARENAAVQQALKPGSCLGSAALGHACPRAKFSTLVESPEIAHTDRPPTHPEVAGGKDCPGQEQNGFALVECSFGPARAMMQVALVGDSHAQQWLPGLLEVAKKQRFHITTHVSSGCNLAAVPQIGPTPGFTSECSRWSTGTLNRVIAEHPDLVVISNRTFRGVRGLVTMTRSYPEYVAKATDALQRLRSAGLRVLVIRDSPIPLFNIPTCIDQNHDDMARCDGTPKWVRRDAWAAAAITMDDSGVRLLDINHHLCTATTCPAVIGNMIVYYDDTHMTATFNRTLAPELGDAVAAMLASK